MPRADRPNILFLLSDQHRPDWLGSTPELPVRTPNIDRLAERGARFTNAVSPSPLCGPARACLASGMEYDRCGVADNSEDYPVDQPTCYQLLRDRGEYHVAGCGKFDLHKGTCDWGPDGTHLLEEWGFSAGVDAADPTTAYPVVREDRLPDIGVEPYLSYLRREGLLDQHLADFEKRWNRGEFRATFPTPLPEEAYCDNWVARNGLDLLAEAPAEQPWFLLVNFTDPHQPMDVTERMHGWYRGDSPAAFPGPVDPDGELAPGTHAEIRRNYAAKVENVDRLVGVYLDELRARGELDDTVIIYASDHGEMLGDHGLWKKTVPYQPSVGVPLVVVGPGVRSQDCLETPVNLIDVSATLLDVAGVSVPDRFDARSLRPVLDGSQPMHRESVYSGLGSWRLAFDGRYKLVTGWDQKDGEVLFDLEQDPDERENVAGEHPETVRELAGTIRQHTAG